MKNYSYGETVEIIKKVIKLLLIDETVTHSVLNSQSKVTYDDKTSE